MTQETGTYVVWDIDGGEGPEHGAVIEADDAEQAAEKYAEDDDDGQVDNVYQNGRILGVRAPDGAVTRVRVDVEWSPTFYGRQQRDDDEADDLDDREGDIPDQTPNGAERWTPECAAGTGARVDAPAVERLDYSVPPPGMYADLEGWGVPFSEQHGRECDQPTNLAAAWAHYKARYDPPEMVVTYIWGGGWAWGPRVDSSEVAFDQQGEAADEPAARAAAWAWYDRRLALAAKLDGHGLDVFWPRCLAWADEQVDAVERWLADTSAPFPEVLRG